MGGYTLKKYSTPSPSTPMLIAGVCPMHNFQIYNNGTPIEYFYGSMCYHRSCFFAQELSLCSVKNTQSYAYAG